MARKKAAGQSIRDSFPPTKVDKNGWPKPPFLMRDSTAYIAKPIVVLERSANAWRGVAWAFEASCVVDRVMEDRYCSAQEDRLKRFHWQSREVDGTANDITPTHLQWMRNQALEHGASPEAIRLLGAVAPFTQKEVNDMTDKLSKKKDAAPKAAKAEKAPKAEKAATAKKGNPEALAKARAARADAGPDTRKITVLKKEGPGYREGSNRAASWAALKGAKTAQDYKDAGGKAKYLSVWAEDGFIKIG